jgi:transposase
MSGQAPVTRQSGKSRLVQRRYACNRRLAEALYHWSRVAMQHDPVSRQRYVALRQRGKSHGRALRGLGDRLLLVACTLLERGCLYDRDHKTTAAEAA